MSLKLLLAEIFCSPPLLSLQAPAEIPYTDVPLHTVIKLTPSTYGELEQRYCLLPMAEDNAHPISSLIGVHAAAAKENASPPLSPGAA